MKETNFSIATITQEAHAGGVHARSLLVARAAVGTAYGWSLCMSTCVRVCACVYARDRGGEGSWSGLGLPLPPSADGVLSQRSKKSRTSINSGPPHPLEDVFLKEEDFLSLMVCFIPLKY